MKKILALVIASVLMVSSTICVCAADTTTGSSSPTTKELEEKIEKLTNEIAVLEQLIRASNSRGGGGGGSSSSGGGSSSSTPTSSSNSVSYNGTVTYQGGKIEINGGRSNATFTIGAPSSSVVSSANTLAGKVGGSLVTCISTSSPGVSFSNAKVNFFVSGVQAGENIAAYQNQNGTWVQLPVTEIRKDHVVVNMTRHGDIAFIRVPVMATIGG